MGKEQHHKQIGPHLEASEGEAREFVRILANDPEFRDHSKHHWLLDFLLDWLCEGKQPSDLLTIVHRFRVEFVRFRGEKSDGWLNSAEEMRYQRMKDRLKAINEAGDYPISIDFQYSPGKGTKFAALRFRSLPVTTAELESVLQKRLRQRGIDRTSQHPGLQSQPVDFVDSEPAHGESISTEHPAAPSPSKNPLRDLTRLMGAHPNNSPKIHLAHLPRVDRHLFGRGIYFDQLDRAWNDPQIRVVCISGFTGLGKTALAMNWVHQFRNNVSANILGWSMQAQGVATEDRFSPAHFFIEHALQLWFQSDPPSRELEARGEYLASLIRNDPTLLVIDGLEVLQTRAGQRPGELKDRAMLILLKELASQNPGLCICTSRFPILDLSDYENDGYLSIDLSKLSAEHGAELLLSLNVEGEREELRSASDEFSGNPYSLILLAGLLKRWRGNIKLRHTIPSLFNSAEGDHARNIIQQYATLFEGRFELQILRMLGLFDRSANAAPIRSLGFSANHQWREALEELAAARLVDFKDPEGPISCHPLVQQHFADEFQQTDPTNFEKLQRALYEYYKSLLPKSVPEISDLQNMYHAIRHGCLGGLHREVLHEIYNSLDSTSDSIWVHRFLDEPGPNLAMLSHFFVAPWTVPIQSLQLYEKAALLEDASFTLRQLGQFIEAIASLEAKVALGGDGTFKNHLDYESLALLHLLVGNIPTAATWASVYVEEKDSESYYLSRGRICAHTILGHVLHQKGEWRPALYHFEQASSIRSDSGLSPDLSGEQLYWYSEILIDLGRPGEALEILRRRREYCTLNAHDESLYRVMCARANPSDVETAKSELDQGIRIMEKYDYIEILPGAKVARAKLFRENEEFAMANQDLTAALKMSNRHSFRLYVADCHIEFAHLHIALGELVQGRKHLEAAQNIVESTGYKRRAEELRKLEIVVLL